MALAGEGVKRHQSHQLPGFSSYVGHSHVHDQHVVARDERCHPVNQLCCISSNDDATAYVYHSKPVASCRNGVNHVIHN